MHDLRLLEGVDKWGLDDWEKVLSGEMFQVGEGDEGGEGEGLVVDFFFAASQSSFFSCPFCPSGITGPFSFHRCVSSQSLFSSSFPFSIFIIY